MKPFIALLVMLFSILSSILFSSEAEDLLKEPRLSQVLDSLNVSMVRGRFSNSVYSHESASTYFKNYIQYDYSPDNYKTKSMGKFIFHNNNSITREIDLMDKKADDFCISTNKQFCLIRNNNSWDLYDVNGKIIRGYTSPESDLIAFEISNAGNVIFYKNINEPLSKKAYKIVIIDSQSKIVYEKEYNSIVELACCSDNSHIALLLKEPEECGFGKPESKLVVLDKNLQIEYEYQFPNYPNQNYFGSGYGTMTFINDILFLIIQHIDESLSYATIDIQNKKIYWSQK